MLAFGVREVFPHWFPKEVYYSATPEQFRVYKKKYFEEKKVGEDSDITDGTQDLLENFSSGKAFAASTITTSAIASASDGPLSTKKSSATSAANLEATGAAVNVISTMDQGVNAAQLKSIQWQQNQQQTQMEHLMIEMKSLLLQPESNEQRSMVQEKTARAHNTSLLSREQLEEHSAYLQDKLDHQLQEHSVLLQEQLSRQQSLEKQIGKLHDLLSTALGQASLSPP